MLSIETYLLVTAASTFTIAIINVVGLVTFRSALRDSRFATFRGTLEKLRSPARPLCEEDTDLEAGIEDEGP